MIDSYHFDRGITKLKERHGSQSYGVQFKQILWSVSRNLSEKQFDFMVDSVIGEHRFEPPISKFKEFASLARHSIRTPDQNFKATEPWPDSIFDKEEIALFFRTLRGVLDGSISKDQKDQMVEYINTRLRGAGIKPEEKT